MRTAWGYDVSDPVSPILTPGEFNHITGGKYQGDNRVEAALKAASQAIRNYCGWHITPSLTCTAYPAGGAAVAKLPAGYVSSIASVEENGVALPEEGYEWRHDGLIRRAFPNRWTDKWDGIEVVYDAGYDPDAVPDLIEVVCSIASGVLAVSAGINSESADGVTISYSSNASSIAAALTSQQKTALEHYKAVSSHAA